MALPNQLHADRSLVFGCGIADSKDSETGRIWTLHIPPPRDVKGPPSDAKSLKGRNDQNLDTPNIYQGEFIRNEPGDTLRIRFEGYIHRNAFKPKTPDKRIATKIKNFLNRMQQKGGLKVIARLMFTNLVTLLWLRKNNETFLLKRKLIFETNYFKHEFTLPDWQEGNISLEQVTASSPQAVNDCIEFIETRLYQCNIDRWFRVTAEIYTGHQMNIYPSQLMAVKPKTDSSNSKEKEGRLFLKGIDKETRCRNIPLFDERQILYALYTFDTWYAEGNNLDHINNNPSGFNYDKYKHFRDYQKGNCIFNYLEKLSKFTLRLRSIDDPEKIPGEMLYTATCLIRGGVFGDK